MPFHFDKEKYTIKNKPDALIISGSAEIFEGENAIPVAASIDMADLSLFTLIKMSRFWKFSPFELLVGSGEGKKIMRISRKKSINIAPAIITNHLDKEIGKIWRNPLHIAALDIADADNNILASVTKDLISNNYVVKNDENIIADVHYVPCFSIQSGSIYQGNYEVVFKSSEEISDLIRSLTIASILCAEMLLNPYKTTLARKVNLIKY